MTVELSNKSPDNYAYGFSTNEKQAIVDAMIAYIPKWEKQILRIENNRKNEGQATYAAMIDDIREKIDLAHRLERYFRPRV